MDQIDFNGFSGRIAFSFNILGGITGITEEVRGFK